VPTLYLLRHGIAVDHGTPGIADDDRPLTAKGKMRIRQIAPGLRRLELGIDQILTSPLPRARTTARIVAQILNIEHSLEDSELLRPDTSLSAIQTMLAEKKQQTLMLVGHNPSLSQLVSLLVVGDAQAPLCELKKGGMAALTPRPLDSGRYDLAWLTTPRLFRRLDSVVED
jgi:phosphohistidine phosphatase